MPFSPHFMAAGLVFCCLLPAFAEAETVACHITYGGETKELLARPTSSPYAVPKIAVGSYFRFRVVFQDRPADTAAIRIYAYADRDDGPALVHQATHHYPPSGRSTAPYGFSGLNFVYEPEGGAELQYWCEWQTEKHRRARTLR